MIKVGTKLTQKDNKKAHNSDALAGDELQALQSANADQHRDRITRFASLKHRAKKQEKYLWTLFTPGNPSDESQLALNLLRNYLNAETTCFLKITLLWAK